MAELLAGVVLQAVDRVLAAQEAAGMAGEAGPAGGGEPRATKLPPPMIPGNADVPTTLCAMQASAGGRAAAGAARPGFSLACMQSAC